MTRLHRVPFALLLLRGKTKTTASLFHSNSDFARDYWFETLFLGSPKLTITQQEDKNFIHQALTSIYRSIIMPKLETMLMARFKLHYGECRRVVNEERAKLGLHRYSPTTTKLYQQCMQRCEGMRAPTQASFSSLNLEDMEEENLILVPDHDDSGSVSSLEDLPGL